MPLAAVRKGADLGLVCAGAQQRLQYRHLLDDPWCCCAARTIRWPRGRCPGRCCAAALHRQRAARRIRDHR